MRKTVFYALLLFTIAISAQNKTKELNVILPQVNVYKHKTTINILHWGDTEVNEDISASVKINDQQHFKNIPPGNYSGITHLKGNEYAVVSDKSDTEGYYIFKIDFTDNGDIKNIQNKGWENIGGPNMDEEAIAYCPLTKNLYIGNEESSTIQEVTLKNETVRTQTIPDYKQLGEHNRIIESVCWDPYRKHFFTINESPLKGDSGYKLRLKELNDNLDEVHQYNYYMDAPEKKDGRPVNEHAHGVSELLSMNDGTLLVLEREFYVTSFKLGSWVVNKVYRIYPGYNGKQLITQWRTSLSLSSFNLANYEGMCEGPQTADGKHVIIFCADSQNQYKGVLKDWFRTITF
jgi:hypothetical protein